MLSKLNSGLLAKVNFAKERKFESKHPEKATEEQKQQAVVEIED